MLSLFGWNRTMRRRFKKALEAEQARRTRELEGMSGVRRADDARRRTKGRGQIALVTAGSYSSSLFAPLSHEFVRAGAEDFLSAPYVLELDAERLEVCLTDMAPPIRDKVVLGSCPHLPGGLAGATIPEVEAVHELWLPDVMDGTKLWLSRLQKDYPSDPAVLVVLLSPGGHAALLLPVLKAFRARYPHVPIYMVTVLDHKTPVRVRLPDIHAYYNQDGLIRGFIETDNRRNARRSDTGLAVLFPALAGSTWISARGMDIWNAFAYVFPPDQPGRVATISVWAEPIPVYHLPTWEKVLPEVYYTNGRLVEEKAMRGIKTVATRPDLLALPIEPAAPGNVRVCCVAAPMVPEQFVRNIERIDAGLGPWLDATDPDLSVQYASIGVPISPVTEEVPLIAVLLQPLGGSTEDVDLYALGAPTDPKFLEPSYPYSRNGHVAKQLGSAAATGA